ncbi:MAG TPA: ATP-binding cassette domain-containing protein, partial [Savagea sp.]
MIVMQSLSKQYGAKHVLSQLEGALPSEQIIGVIGRNGVGKSTLFRLLAGLEKPTGGSVQWEGIEIFNQLQASAHTLLINEHFQLLEHLTLADGIREM